MFKLSEIKELIKLVDQSTLQEVEIENEGSRLLATRVTRRGEHGVYLPDFFCGPSDF